MTVQMCSKCGQSGHLASRCQERRLAKIWAGQFVFRGKIRTPDGSVIELETPLGDAGQRILDELVGIAAKGRRPSA